MQIHIINRLWLPALIILLISMGCGSRGESFVLENPDGYNMKKAVQMKLPLDLDEISGIAYYPPDSSVFAINDEKGWLYKISNGRGIMHWEFSKGADFEDLVLLDSIFYVLESSGNILRLSFNAQNSIAVQEYTFDKGTGKDEFEILYYDPGRKKLILICKDCDLDKKHSLSTFAFDPTTGQYEDSPFTINVQEIAHSLGDDKMKFKPSAASINPKNGLLYIISSINKLLVVMDSDGKLVKAYRIDPVVFKQPEGISFSPTGGMLISNESADVGVADILFYPYLKP